jgi:hypothetical protein
MVLATQDEKSEQKVVKRVAGKRRAAASRSTGKKRARPADPGDDDSVSDSDEVRHLRCHGGFCVGCLLSSM